MWSANVASRLKAESFRLASRAGDARLLADLIVDARSMGTFTLAAASDVSSGQASPVIPVPSESESEDVVDRTLARAASGAVWRSLGREGTQLRPPPFVLSEHGTVALDWHHATAARLFGAGLRARTALSL